METTNRKSVAFDTVFQGCVYFLIAAVFAGPIFGVVTTWKEYLALLLLALAVANALVLFDYRQAKER